MNERTIKISEENYRWLLGIAAELQKKKEVRVSFDNAIDSFKEKERINVLRETFGTHKFKKPVKKLMKETDMELDYG